MSLHNVRQRSIAVALVLTGLGTLVARGSGEARTDFGPVQHAVRVIASGSDGVIAAGSGVVVLDGSYVLTNRHVVWRDGNSQPRTEIEVQVAPTRALFGHPSERSLADLVAADELADLALLRVRDPETTSGRQAKLDDGSWPDLSADVTLVAFPSAGEDTVTLTHGKVAGYLHGRDYMKLDARADLGSSGGGVFNSDGRLVGLVARVLRSDDSGAAFLALAKTAPVVREFLARIDSGELRSRIVNSQPPLGRLNIGPNSTHTDNRARPRVGDGLDSRAISVGPSQAGDLDGYLDQSEPIDDGDEPRLSSNDEAHRRK